MPNFQVVIQNFKINADVTKNDLIFAFYEMLAQMINSQIITCSQNFVDDDYKPPLGYYIARHSHQGHGAIKGNTEFEMISTANNYESLD